MRKFFVMGSPAYGGAEKRFFDVYTAMRRDGVDVGFIGPSCLLDRLRDDHPERADVFAGFVSVPMPSWRPLAFVRRLRATIAGLPRRSSFHYPLLCLWPLHLGRGDRISLSIVDSARIPRLFNSSRNMKWSWLAMQFADRIDVLNPSHMEAMRRYRVAPRMTLTPGGTYMVPPPDLGESVRRPSVVFLGRLVPLKGLDHYLDVLPAVWQSIRTAVPPGFSFDFAGYGPLEEHLLSRLEPLRAQGLPVRFLGYADAAVVLAQSTVLVSMQECTNFPSRVVAEALVAGCGVVVRDTGDSRSFGNDMPGLRYCEASLRPDELAGLLLELLDDGPGSDERRRAVKAAARERYNSPAYIRYFADLLSASSPAPTGQSNPGQR